MEHSSFKKRVISGTFDCEGFWRDDSLAKLPSIADKQAQNIVMAMDELLFLFTRNPKDTLITRFQMDARHKDYLSDLGFQFQVTSLFDDFSESAGAAAKNSCQLIYEREVPKTISPKSLKRPEYLPFSVMAESFAVSRKLNLDFNAPDYQTVKKVNSKLYSSHLNAELGSGNDFDIIYSASELQQKGEAYLEKSEFLIKDTFGVSGRGNLLISSPKMLEQIVQYLTMQERKDKNILLILESFLQKELDFSCQFYLDKLGNTEILSIQQVGNRNFSYGGSFTVDQQFWENLEQQGYFQTMRQVANRLYQDGYYGHVCIDSMILKDGRLIPVVEINARSSMSLIKYQLDEYLAKVKLTCAFTSFSLHFNCQIDFEQLMDKMEQRDLLYLPGMSSGVIPLSSNTLLINQKIQQQQGKCDVKGRLYVALVYQNDQQRQELNEDLLAFLEANSLHTHLATR